MFVIAALNVTGCLKKNKHYSDVLGEQSSLAPRDDDVFEHLEGFEHPMIEGKKLSSNAII